MTYAEAKDKLLDIAEEEGYFRLYNSINRHLDLSGTRAIIFSYIFSFSICGKDEDGYCFSSRETMAKSLNISLSTLDLNLKKLVSEKLICKSSCVSHNHVYPIYCVNVDHILKRVLESKRIELEECLSKIGPIR